MGIGEVIAIVILTLVVVAIAGSALMAFLNWLASQFKD